MAETLWNKGKEATNKVEDFTVGNDRILDMRLARYDVEGSLAHIKMLQSIGLLTDEELERLTAGLEEILGEIKDGKFRLEDTVEDIHSQVELLLTRRLGEIGKKIHSGRSRNDQVLVDVKLFLKDEVLKFREEVLVLFGRLQELSEKYKDVLLPGYTHGQVAMPSPGISSGIWKLLSPGQGDDHQAAGIRLHGIQLRGGSAEQREKRKGSSFSDREHSTDTQ